MINIALVGLDWWGTRVAKQIIRSKKTHLYTCFARTPETREKFAHEHNCAAAESFESILNDPQVDALVLETPNSAHKDQVIAAARHGKHVLVDKPLTNYLGEAVAVYRETRDQDVVLAVGHNSRRRPEIKVIKRILEEGNLGKPVLIEGNFSTDRGLRLSQYEWRWSKKECPGGPLLQLGIHHIDTFRHLFGSITAVFSVQKKKYVQAQIVDNTITCLEFEDGYLGYVGSSYVGYPTCRLSVYMTKGKIYYDDDFGLMIFQNGKCEKASYEPDTSTDDSLREEIEEFAFCIEQGKTPDVSIKDGLLAVAVLEAARRANKTETKIYVQELLQKYGLPP